jgi:hypothetical protein
VCPLEGRHEVAIASSNLVDGGVSGVLLVAPADDWLPERSAADDDADEARNWGGRLQPFVHPLVVLTLPRMMQPTFLRPSRHAAATIFSQSSRRSRTWMLGRIAAR